MIIRPVNGQARKIYKLKNGKVNNRFQIGSNHQLIEKIPKESLTQTQLADAIRKARQESGFLLPNLPNLGQYDEFSISKRAFKDDPRRWFCADVDSEVKTKKLLSLSLEALGAAWIKSEGLPPNTGFIATWSSSRFVKEIDKLGYHLWFVLSDSYTEDELKELTGTLNCDASMCEKTRIHCVLPPTLSEGVELSDDWSRYDEIVVVKGDSLDLDKVHGTKINIRNPEADSEEYDNRIWQEDRENLFAGLKEYFHDKGESVPYKDPTKLAKASEQLLLNRKIQHRHSIHYWLMRLAYERTGDTYDSMSEILNSRVLLGNHEPRELINQADKIKADFLDQTTGGNVASSFEPDEIISVECESGEGLTEEQVSQLFEDKTISCLTPFEGWGKSFFVIKRGLDISDPKTVISVCHRNAALRQQAKDWDLIYKDDIGKDNPAYEKLSEKDRKIQFWPDCDNPAITIQSIKYIARNGEVEEYSTVLIDEIEHVLREIYIKPDLQADKNMYDSHSKRFHLLLTICSQANNVIVADASASRDFTAWFVDEVVRLSGKSKKLLRTNIDYVQRMKFRELSSLEEAILTVVELLKEGKKVAITTDHGDNAEKGKMERIMLPIKSLANLKDNEIFWATGKSTKFGQGLSIAEDPSEIGRMIDDGLRCIGISPVFDSAWSYHLEDEHRFDAIVQIFDHGLTHADDMKQMFRRFRLTTDVYTYNNSKFKMKVA